MPKIKYGDYVKNLDECKLIGTHWIVLYVNGDNVTYFDSSGAEHISKETKKIMRNKNIKTNIYSIQGNDWRICGYFCMGFTGFMLKGKIMFDCANLISPNKYEIKDEMILKLFQ